MPRRTERVTRRLSLDGPAPLKRLHHLITVDAETSKCRWISDSAGVPPEALAMNLAMKARYSNWRTVGLGESPLFPGRLEGDVHG